MLVNKPHIAYGIGAVDLVCINYDVIEQPRYSLSLADSWQQTHATLYHLLTHGSKLTPLQTASDVIVYVCLCYNVLL